MEASVKSAIVSLLQIEDWRIRNLVCVNGSIIAKFDFLPPDENLVPNALEVFNAQLELLKSSVKDGSFSVQLSDGSSLSVDVDYEIVKSEEPDKANIKDSDSLLPLYISLGVVGGIVLIAIAVFVVMKFKPFTRSYIV